MQTEGMEDLMSPGKRSLNAELAFVGTLLDGSAGDGEADKLFPNRGSLMTAFKYGIGCGNKEADTALAEVSLDPSLKTLFDDEALVGFGSAMRAIRLLVLEGVLLNQTVTAVLFLHVGRLHHAHDLIHELLLLAGGQLFQHSHQLVQFCSSCHNPCTSM